MDASGEFEFDPAQPLGWLSVLCALIFPEAKRRLMSGAALTVAALDEVENARLLTSPTLSPRTKEKVLGLIEIATEGRLAQKPPPDLSELRFFGSPAFSAERTQAFIGNRVVAHKAVLEAREAVDRLGDGHTIQRMLANTDNVTLMFKQIETKFDHGALYAALQLLTFARLRATTPDGSLTRARNMLVNYWYDNDSFPNHNNLIKAWGEWRPLIPLWAGMLFESGYPWGSTPGLLVSDEIKHAFFDVFESPDRLSNALRYGKWFHTKQMSIPEPKWKGKDGKVPEPSVPAEIKLRGDFGELEPSFSQFSPSESRWASSNTRDPSRIRGRAKMETSDWDED